MPIPTFIRTGDSYFDEKELHLNSMLQKRGLPTVFITLSMAESRWTELQDILRQTDDNNTIPTNKPLHCALHFMHRFRSLKNKIWKNKEISGWGTWWSWYRGFYDTLVILIKIMNYLIKLSIVI